MTTELLAQIVEEVSVVATHNMGRKKPIKVPRPDHVKNAGKGGRRRTPPVTQAGPGAGETAAENVVDMAGYRHAIGVLAGTRRP